LRKRTRETLDRGKLGGRIGPVAIQQVKIDVRTWGFQLHRNNGKLDGAGVAEARRRTLSIIEPCGVQERPGLGLGPIASDHWASIIMAGAPKIEWNSTGVPALCIVEILSWGRGW
jgi:hypothetical protein